MERVKRLALGSQVTSPNMGHGDTAAASVLPRPVPAADDGFASAAVAGEGGRQPGGPPTTLADDDTERVYRRQAHRLRALHFERMARGSADDGR
jgi:hypothetical protein